MSKADKIKKFEKESEKLIGKPGEGKGLKIVDFIEFIKGLKLVDCNVTFDEIQGSDRIVEMMRENLGIKKIRN
jgi:hypothetical protein